MHAINIEGLFCKISLELIIFGLPDKGRLINRSVSSKGINE